MTHVIFSDKQTGKILVSMELVVWNLLSDGSKMSLIVAVARTTEEGSNGNPEIIISGL